MKRLHGTFVLGVQGNVYAVADAGGLLIVRHPNPQLRHGFAIGDRVRQEFHHPLVAERGQNQVVEPGRTFDVSDADGHVMQHEPLLLFFAL